MRKNYLKLQNQGHIYKHLMLLNEMYESSGYADENGYFSKRAVAEIAINSAIITSAGKMGDDILALVNDTVSDESRNSVLQNAKERMQILRVLGLVASDYDAELYAITDFGEKVLAQVFPSSAENIPDYRLLMESFMGISSSSEVYDYNCDINFNCYLGYAVCYALSNLDYRISVQEMPCITTYDINEIDSFIDTVKHYRELNSQIPNTHEHFPKTQQGRPLAQVGNITRTINQILRTCGIIARKTIRIDGINYYTCTEKGKVYVDDIKNSMKKKRFWIPQYFRKENLLAQKRICTLGYNNILEKGGYVISSEAMDNVTVFSPYQLIPEINVNWLLEKPIRKAPISKETQIQVINSQISVSSLRLKPTYRTQDEYDLYIKTYSSKTAIIQEILKAKNDGKEKSYIVDQLMDKHKNSDKSLFYPFVHSLIGALGLDCLGEVGRFDALIKYEDVKIPMEIKSFTETPAYNMKGIRQALENKICLYNVKYDLNYASLLLGYSHPMSTIEIQNFIDAAFGEWGIKLIALDLRNLIEMCVRIVWEKQIIDFDTLFQEHGILEA